MHPSVCLRGPSSLRLHHVLPDLREKSLLERTDWVWRGQKGHKPSSYGHRNGTEEVYRSPGARRELEDDRWEWKKCRWSRRWKVLMMTITECSLRSGIDWWTTTTQCDRCLWWERACARVRCPAAPRPATNGYYLHRSSRSLFLWFPDCSFSLKWPRQRRRGVYNQSFRLTSTPKSK